MDDSARAIWDEAKREDLEPNYERADVNMGLHLSLL